MEFHLSKKERDEFTFTLLIKKIIHFSFKINIHPRKKLKTKKWNKKRTIEGVADNRERERESGIWVKIE